MAAIEADLGQNLRAIADHVGDCPVTRVHQDHPDSWANLSTIIRGIMHASATSSIVGIIWEGDSGPSLRERWTFMRTLAESPPATLKNKWCRS